ncbi:hypothetical protein PI95_021060 [Hassallia byssoidea VB512170]|uniref:Uncharacterized protein n=1 Tax=Hassallia byssoidea VB512170 TaxID=1304833 RepID=A0A846HCC1_9CYAN|nr:hypothetical protein [Hassalia byssoidea]NEU74976.1 hypothetical protein [Hassalia byssoidea VB512170]
MPNPKGNPDNLQPFTTDRDEPLIGKLTVRVPESILAKLKSINNYPEFVRQAIYKALSELEGSEDEIT